jgi:hypothetical protein
MILFFPCTLTQLGQFKYGLLKNKVTGVVDIESSYGPGLYWIGFWKEFVEFPSVLNTIEFSNEGVEEDVQDLAALRSRDKDGKLIFLDVSIQYLLHQDKVGFIYKDMLTYYEDIFISELRDQIAKAANLFSVQEIWQSYSTVVDLMTQRCVTVLTLRHAECWGLQLWGVRLSSGFENKLIATQVRKQGQKTALASKLQEEVRATTRVLVAEYQKQITIKEAEGSADVYQITTLARSTASSNLVRAQADVLQIIRDRVCLPNEKASCADNPGFLDERNYFCRAWRGHNCSTAVESEGYSQQGEDAVLNNCHASCGLCQVNGTTNICNAQGSGTMSGRHMVAYEKQVLLKTLNASQLVVTQTGSEHVEAINVEAQRKIMNGQARRLLLHEGRDLGDSDDYINENTEEFNQNPLTTLHEL